MQKSGHVSMGGCFHSFIHQVFIDTKMNQPWTLPWVVLNYSLNCELKGKGKWLLIGLMRNKL